MSLFDTHCHLDDPRLEADLEGVLARAAEAGVEAITTIGCANSVENVGSALAIARAHPGRVWATTGVHPHDATTYDDALHAALEEVARAPEVVAIGEMGLDYYYDNSPRETQQEVFRRQVALARAVGKPMVVHTRDAADDTLRMLDEEQARDVGGIIHCFSEGPDFARAALDLGFVISFSGIVTFKNATAIREAAQMVPLDSLLVETDAPYLAPVPHRGKPNEPAFVAYTARCVADLRGIDYEQLSLASTANARRVFRLEPGPTPKTS